ncbi:hypothetical protein EZJ49_01710 [Bdellovibrio bacteriovorus]|uniref:immunoglobulin domain-containing protein n=1 Tax=Bdellovibrio bacteriovorus TaxID=959 RepID=UPI0021D1620B|nr:immunoglobulin domain-containing protein [Bdellovibrio bacteriovorus]UXR64965.1 hypothetical protein EZJ49_01710 [Bdellovibrio bacteriovorus]
MNRRILRKIRNFRVLSAIVVASLTIVSFQNCAPQNSLCSGSDCDKDTSGGSSASGSKGSGNSSIWGSRPGSSGGINMGGGSNGGGSGSGSSSGGAVTIGGGGSSGGGSSSGGGAVTIGGGGGSSGSGSNGGGDGPLKIVNHPSSVSVQENGNFQLEVTFTGGTSPYTIQWYKNSAAITNGMGHYSFYSGSADSWSNEGTYYVVIKDAKSQSVQSNLARVTILEPAVGCPAGRYFTYTNATYDQAYNYFTEYFDGPRGKFLLHQGYDRYNVLFQAPSYSKLSSYDVPALKYLDKTWMNCRTTIPRIHTPTVNPNYDYEYGDRYADNYAYKYTGEVQFECRNNKLKLIANTCKWVKQPN